MNRTDTATRRATTAIVAAVALFAAGDSFTHIYDLARQHGEGAVSAALLPLAGDGLWASACFLRTRPVAIVRRVAETMTIDPGSEVAPYLQLAGILRAQIESGELAPGSRAAVHRRTVGAVRGGQGLKP